MCDIRLSMDDDGDKVELLATSRVVIETKAWVIRTESTQGDKIQGGMLLTVWKTNGCCSEGKIPHGPLEKKSDRVWIGT